MQISRHWRMNSQRYRLEGVKYPNGEVSLQHRPLWPIGSMSKEGAPRPTENPSVIAESESVIALPLLKSLYEEPKS